MSAAKAVLFVGSPRGLQSASRGLGQRLLDGLASRGMAVETHSIYAALDSPEKDEALISAALSADVLIFSFPLYVDQLPAPVIRTLDRIAAGRQLHPIRGVPRPRLAALVQCGFPETHQNQPAIDIMRRFADFNGFEWAGGLAMGMGGMAGRPLPEKPKGMLRNVLRAIDEASAGLAHGGMIPQGASARMARPLMAPWLYFAGANWGWRQQARRNGRKAGRRIDLRGRPYA
jgi:multimeric flavodoxin WrbA